MLIKSLYTLFLAILISLFVGLGIDSFYREPTRPEYPTKLEVIEPGKAGPNAEQLIAQKEFDSAQKKYTEELKKYNKNVSIVSLIAAIVILVVSLTFASKIKMIADGVLLGGVFITVYSIIRGFMSESSQFRFLVVTIGLIIALVLGYVKFIKPQKDF